MESVYLLKDLSQLSGLSIDTIKYYLKLGLIKEIERSPNTNFRYFDDSTIKKLAQIRQMRKNNTPLMKIKEILNNPKGSQDG
jgi:DNA-binding transcriptional MerR regulator